MGISDERGDSSLTQCAAPSLFRSCHPSSVPGSSKRGCSSSEHLGQYTLTKTLARQPGPILPSEQPHRASEANLVQSSAPLDGSLHEEQPAGGSCGQSDKLRGSEHPRLSCSSGGQRSDIALCRLKSRCRQGLSPSGNSRGESVPLPFQLLETAYVPCPVASHHSKLIVRSPSPPLTPRVPLTGTPVAPGLGTFQNDPGWLPHVRGLNLVTSVMSLFSCNVTATGPRA